MSLSPWGPAALEARAGGRRPLRAVFAPEDTRAEEGRPAWAPGPSRLPGLRPPPRIPPPPATPVPRISPRFPDPPGPPRTPRISPGLPHSRVFAPLRPSPAPRAFPAHLSPSLCGSPALPAPGALARAEAAGCVLGEAEWPSLTPGELCGAWSAVGPGRRALAGGRSPEGTVRVGPTWALPPPDRPGREEAREAPAAPPLGGGQDWGEEARAARTPGAGGSAVARGRGSVLPQARSGVDLWLRKAQGPPVGFPPSFRLPHLVWVP